MHDVAGPVRPPGSGPARTSSATLVLIWLAWVLIPPLLVFGAAITSAPFFGEEPTAAERSQSTVLLLVAAGLALALPLLGLLLTRRTRPVATACFAVALLVAAVPVALLLAEAYRDADLSRPAPDPGPPVCQEHSGGDTRCPGG